MIQIQLRGVNKVQRLIKNLPKELNKEINEESGSFMKDVRKSAKLRAPKQTGDLARSIKIIRKENQWKLVVDSPYGKYQEEGFKPHWIHANLSTKNKLGTVGNALNIGGFVKVSKHTPFVKPALEHNLSKLAQRMNKATNRAIKRSKK